MYIVTEIHDNSLGRAWAFSTLEEAIDQAMLSVKAIKCTCGYEFTREDMETNLSFWCGDRSVCVGQTEIEVHKRSY